MDATVAVYGELQRHFGAVRPDRKGENWTVCPFCGKAGKHFSFSVNGFYCFHCGQKGSLWDLAEFERIQREAGWQRPAYVPTPPRARPVPQWADQGLGQYLDHPDRYTAWAAYKPVTVASIDKYKLGCGKLPFKGDYGWYQSKTDWLVVPLFAPDGSPGVAVMRECWFCRWSDFRENLETHKSESLCRNPANKKKESKAV